jgi:MFS family permease
VSLTTQPRLLADRDFRLWYLSRSASVAGTAASAVVLPLMAYQLTDSAALTAAVVGLEAMPYLLFGLLAGAAADRLRRKAMMIGADIGCAFLLLTLPAADAFGALTVWHVLAVAFGLGCGFCWFDAATWGAWMRLVGKARITQANSLIWSTEVVLEIAAPAAAGLIAVMTAPTVVVGLDAASYLASAALIVQIRAPLDATPQAPRHRLRAEIAEGLAYLWRQPVIRTLSLTGFAFNVACGGTLGLLVVHADKVLRVSTPDPRIGLLYTAMAVGSLIATLALPAFTREAGQGTVSIVGLGLFVAAATGLATIPAFAAALLLWAIRAFARVTVNGNGITVRQLLTPDELQGRVNTTGRMIAWGGTPFGALLGGLVADSFGVRAAYLVLALPAAIGLCALLASPVRGLRIETATERTRLAR